MAAPVLHVIPARSHAETVPYLGPRGLLEIDCASGDARRTSLPDEVFDDAIGGVALALRLYADGPHGDPLVFAAGPFGSTPVPAGYAHAYAVRLTGGRLAAGLAASHWSATLRRCGLAAVVLRGRSPQPALIVVDHDRVTIEDGGWLPAGDAKATVKAVRKRLVDRTARVVTMTEGGALDAALAARGIVAIAVRGRGEVPVADAPVADELVADLRRRLAAAPAKPDRPRERADLIELRAGCASCPVQCEQMYVVRERPGRPARITEPPAPLRPPTAAELLWESLVLCRFVRHVIDDLPAEGAALLRAVNGGAAAPATLAAAAERALARWHILDVAND